MCRVDRHLLCVGWVGICCVEGGWVGICCVEGGHLLCAGWVRICCVEGGWAFAVYRVSICCVHRGYLLCTCVQVGICCVQHGHVLCAGSAFVVYSVGICCVQGGHLLYAGWAFAVQGSVWGSCWEWGAGRQGSVAVGGWVVWGRMVVFMWGWTVGGLSLIHI